MPVDFLVVGAGLTGATIARHLTDHGRSVLVIDQRDHVAGNVHDQIHEASGIRWHTYGPHYFRTNNARLWEYVNRFADWYRYEPCLLSDIDGTLEPWPVTVDVIHRYAGTDWLPAHTGPVETFEDASLAIMPKEVYELFVKGYTEKQWGQPAATLSPSLAGRFDVRTGSDLRLKDHRHQGIPIGGYTAWVENMLDGIRVELGHAWPSKVKARHVVFTGPIDAHYGHDLGRLGYRSQHRAHRWQPDQLQPCGQVNNPGSGDHIRTLEWNHMLEPNERARTRGSLVTTETPRPDGYEYPIPDAHNATLYAKYRDRANAEHAVTICGRLGEYRYYDMDQAIGRAQRIAARLLA